VNAHLSSAVFLSAGLVAQAQDFALDNLPTLHSFQSHRITSADPTGKSDDWRRLEPGQTLVLAEISDRAPRAFPSTVTDLIPIVIVPTLASWGFEGLSRTGVVVWCQITAL